MQHTEYTGRSVVNKWDEIVVNKYFFLIGAYKT